MAYKFQEGAANLDGEVSGSSFRTAGSLSGSGDLAVTGNMHASLYYGDGSNLTNISAELIDVTSSSDNVSFKLAFVENLGTGVDLAGNAGLSYNPTAAILSSSAAVQFVGDSIFGGSLDITGAVSAASFNANAGGISNAGAIAGASTGNFSDTLTVVQIQASGKLSSSAEMEIVGQVDIVSTLNVTGASALNGGIDVNGSNFTAGTDGAVTMTSLSVQTGDIGTFANISGSGIAQFGGTMNSFGINTSGNIALQEGMYIGIPADTDILEFTNSQLTVNASLVHTAGVISSSGGANFASSISSSGDLAVTGNVHAAEFYGGGAGITGISSDAVDVTSSGENIAYPIVFTQGAQSDGSLGLGLNTALNYNPTTAILSSSAGVQFGGNSVIDGTLNVTGASDFLAVLNANGGLDVNGSNFTAATNGAVTMTSLSVQTGDIGTFANISGSGIAQFVGNAFLGAALNVTGVASLDGGINVNDAYTVSAAGAVVADELRTDGYEFVVSTAGLVTTTGITNAGAVLSSSHAAEIVGNSRLVGNVGVTGAISLDSDGGGLNFDGGSNVVKITNNGGNIMGFGAGSFHFNSMISGSGDLEVVSAARLGSTLGLSGAADFESTLEVQSGVYNHGYRKYEISTITESTELTASSSKSYQMVSGGTSALTVILPSASAGQYYQYGIKRHSLMSGNVVLEGNGAELIDGETNVTLSSVNASVYLISDGTQWNIF